jgi:predicted nucleic acid-binding protein
MVNYLKTVYLDTLHIIDIIIIGKKDEKKQSKRLFKKLDKGGFEIVLSQIVLGESIAKLLQYKDKEPNISLDNIHSNIIKKYNIVAKKCFPPLNTKVDNIAQELLNHDNELHVTDAVIVAFALADPNAKFFFTRDGKLLNNKIIMKYEKELREKKKEKCKINNY